ncbi:jg13908 [Pararge aegeria aegeria]|uniref:Jg13908 protein n=1 Tax=Pararge aegeria aegeria TaxID=348720 RepID=A0A8S4S9I3_9NEOP|nr:jg13908 [Pararge aegeria aegeria]
MNLTTVFVKLPPLSKPLQTRPKKNSWSSNRGSLFMSPFTIVTSIKKCILLQNSSPNGSNVTLYPAVLETGGRYRCEVSGERPLFPTVSDHADMTIVALPATGPIISGSRLRYQIGDRVQVNCTSGRSRPATRLSWYINGEPAPASAVLPPEHFQHDDGLETTTMGLDFKVKSKHFRKGDLKLKCLATIATVYWRSNEESVQGERLKGYARSRELLEGTSRADRVQAAGKSTGCRATLPLLLLLLVHYSAILRRF